MPFYKFVFIFRFFEYHIEVDQNCRNDISIIFGFVCHVRKVNNSNLYAEENIPNKSSRFKFSVLKSYLLSLIWTLKLFFAHLFRQHSRRVTPIPRLFRIIGKFQICFDCNFPQFWKGEYFANMRQTCYICLAWMILQSFF